MNTKTKMMLGLSVLTAGTLAAGATGTFAWFTTNRSITATYSNIVAVGTTADLQATINPVEGTATVTGANTSNVSAEGTKAYVSDVSSGDGNTFYKPDWKSVAGNDAEVNKVNDVSAKNGYFTRYTITVKNASTDTGSDVKLYLSGLTITTPGTTYIADWTRVSVSIGATAASTKYIYQNSTDEAACKYIENTTLTDNKLTLATDLTPIKAEKELSSKLEVKSSLKASESVTLTVTVWLEGTMNDDQDDAKGEKVAVGMTFTSEDNTVAN